MKTWAVARRILEQFLHDKRTLALLFVAPLVVLWLLSVLLGAGTYSPKIATVDLPSSLESALDKQDATITAMSEQDAASQLENDDIDAVLRLTGDDDKTLDIWVEGTDSTKTAAVAQVVAEAMQDVQEDAQSEMESRLDELKTSVAELQKAAAAMGLDGITLSGGSGTDSSTTESLDLDDYLPVTSTETTYLHGGKDWKMFDYYGPIFIGIFIFVFTFITSGMSLVNERSAGTMQRFLATPVKSGQILGGYSIGFGLLACVQSAVILLVALTLIGFPDAGNLGLVILMTVSMAMVSVTLGLLVSGLASSAFQVIQLMLLFVVPQILLCGLFDLSTAPRWMQVLGQCMPVTYGVNALTSIMLRGWGFDKTWVDFLVVWCFIVAFFVLAALGFRKKRVRHHLAINGR
ncbi:ABC transporter permease [Bifidobacterium choloepi]|nr:ABC transporter permease [Bifidobacterium choloepi]